MFSLIGLFASGSGTPFSPRWAFQAAAGFLYFCIVLWRSLPENHRHGEAQLFPTIGLANSVTLLRALLMSAVVGFLGMPRPDGAAAWVPGVLYTLASLPDYVDGIIARKTHQVTRLGEVLDMTVDSVGVFTATFLSVQYGVIPWWYLPIGLARYLFVMGLWLRERSGRPVFPLPFSYRRRGFAALKMGFMFVMLFPLFGPPGTHTAAAAFGIPFAAAFLYDWGLATGWTPPRIPPRLTAFLRASVPWLLRALAVLLALPLILKHLEAPDLRLLAYAEIGASLLLALGIAPRAAAILAVCLVGVNQNLAPLAPFQHLLAAVYIGMIFLGSGRFSVFPVEDRLIFHRIGDPV